MERGRPDWKDVDMPMANLMRSLDVYGIALRTKRREQAQGHAIVKMDVLLDARAKYRA